MACCDTVQLAAERGHIECMKVLRDGGVDVSTYSYIFEWYGSAESAVPEERRVFGAVEGDSMSRTALHSACAFGHLPLVKWLVDNGASVDCEIYEGYGLTPLFCAVYYRHYDVARWLLEAGANPDACVISPVYRDEWDKISGTCCGVHGMTPVYVACIKLDLASVRLLLEFGANASLGERHYGEYQHQRCDPDGPLVRAVNESVYFPIGAPEWQVALDIAKALAAGGADLHADGVLNSVAYFGLDALKHFLAAGLSIELSASGCNASLDILRYFLGHVPNFATSYAGLDTMVLSCPQLSLCDLSEVVGLYLSLGGDINLHSMRDQETLLSSAVDSGSLDRVLFLLQCGASPNVCVEGVNLCVNVLLDTARDALLGNHEAQKLEGVHRAILMALVRYGLRWPVRLSLRVWHRGRGTIDFSGEYFAKITRVYAFFGAPVEAALQYSADGNSYVPTLQHLCRRVIIAHDLKFADPDVGLPQHLVDYLSVTISNEML